MDERDPAVVPVDDAPHAAAGTRWTGRAARIGVALLVVLLAVGVAGQAVVTARERDRLAALAGVPGVLDLLDGPPEVLWTSPDGAPFFATARTAPDLLVSVTTSQGGAVDVRAHDARTGVAAWDVELLGTAEVLPAPGGSLQPSSESWCLEHPADGTVVCLVGNGSSTYHDGEREVVPPTVSRLLVLDPQDGTVLADLSEVVGEPLADRSLAFVGDLVVVCGLRGDEVHTQAVTRAGTVAWSSTVTSGTSEHGPRGYVVTVGDLVALWTAGDLRLLDATGATVQRVELGAEDFVLGTAGPAGDALVLRTGPDRVAHAVRRLVPSVLTDSTTVLRGATEVTVPGTYAMPQVDDGSVPGLLLTTDAGGLRAWDARGEPLWTAPVAAARRGSVVVAEGRVHVASTSTAVTLDARTGRELWQSTTPTGSDRQLTDGRHLLVVDGRELVALDPADGSEAWRTPMPDGVDDVTSVHGLLVGYASTFEGASGPATVVLGHPDGDS